MLFRFSLSLLSNSCIQYFLVFVDRPYSPPPGCALYAQWSKNLHANTKIIENNDILILGSVTLGREKSKRSSVHTDCTLARVVTPSLLDTLEVLSRSWLFRTAPLEYGRSTFFFTWDNPTERQTGNRLSSPKETWDRAVGETFLGQHSRR